jgi:hypothetical protein
MHAHILYLVHIGANVIKRHSFIRTAFENSCIFMTQKLGQHFGYLEAA